MGGWKSVEEISAYRLAVELRDRVIQFTESGPAARDFDFRNQIRSSSSSTTKNLAKGFNRFFHGEFGYLAIVAKGSLGETIDALKDAKARGYLSPAEFERLHALADRAAKATAGLIRYLLSSEAPGESTLRPKRRRRRKAG